MGTQHSTGWTVRRTVSSCGHSAGCYHLLVPSDALVVADERVLWYSEADRDWNISPGLVPDPTALLAFGGSGLGEPRPQLVSSRAWWFVRSELRSVEVRHISG